MRDIDSNTVSVLDTIKGMLADLNPVRLWEALQEADEGVCLMVPVPVKQQRQRRR